MAISPVGRGVPAEDTLKGASAGETMRAHASKTRITATITITRNAAWKGEGCALFANPISGSNFDYGKAWDG
jgi:hypothetical protein